MITMKQWQGSFEELTEGKKLPLEVSEEIYTYFLECLPPEEMGKTREDFMGLPIPVQRYFLVGEPQTHILGKPVFACFARAYDSKYFFVGYIHKSINTI